MAKNIVIITNSISRGMSEPLISVSQLKKTSLEAIVTQDIDFLTKLQADVTSFLSRITTDMQSSYLKHVRSMARSHQNIEKRPIPIKNWVFNFCVGDNRPEYHFLIVKNFRDQGYIIKKSKLKQGYYLVSDAPFEEQLTITPVQEPIRLTTISNILPEIPSHESQKEIKFDNTDIRSPSDQTDSESLPQIQIFTSNTTNQNQVHSDSPAFKGIFEYINQMTHKLAKLDQLFMFQETMKQA